MEYYIVSREWLCAHEVKEWRETNTFSKKTSIDVYEYNISQFEADINAELEDGWEPLGSPQFSGRWTGKAGYNRSVNIATQALVRRKKLAEPTPPRHSSRLSSNTAK